MTVAALLIDYGTLLTDWQPTYWLWHHTYWLATYLLTVVALLF